MPTRIANGIELLADPTRRRIVMLIAERPRRPSGLARELGLSRPAISRQLRLLREASLIRDLPAQDGRFRLIGLQPENEPRIAAFLAGTELGLLPDRRPKQERWRSRGERTT